MNTCQIFAALANSDTRDMYARVILDQVPEAPTSKQSRALLDLHRAGLIGPSQMSMGRCLSPRPVSAGGEQGA